MSRYKELCQACSLKEIILRTYLQNKHHFLPSWLILARKYHKRSNWCRNFWPSIDTLHKKNFEDHSQIRVQSLKKYTLEFFLNCYLASPWPILGHYWGDSLPQWMLITVVELSWPTRHWEHCKEIVSLSLIKCLVGVWTRNLLILIVVS